MPRGFCGSRGNDADLEILPRGRGSANARPDRVECPSPAWRLEAISGFHTFCNNRVASYGRAKRTSARGHRRRGARPAAREIRVADAALASFRSRSAPLALTSRPPAESHFSQKYHSGEISAVDRCRLKASALACLIAAVRPHGRGECSCERAPAVRSPTAGASLSPPHVWMAPNLQELFSWGALVACSHVSGLSVRSRMTAGLDGFRGSRPYQLVGIGIPLRRSGFSRSVGSTDCAITCFSLSQACGTPQLS